MNPMIPLDAANSSIPCAIFQSHGEERGGDAGRGDVVCHAPKRGRQRRVGRHSRRTIRRVWREPQPRGPQPCLDGRGHGQVGRPHRLRTREGPHGRRPRSARPGAVLAGRTAGPDGRAGRAAGPDCRRRWRRAGRWRRGRISSRPSPCSRSKSGDFSAVATVFEDFEWKTYEGWTITGDAFGKGPSHGTEGGQQPVSGFAGHGLVNTFQGGDGPQGTATSKPFPIYAALHRLSDRRRRSSRAKRASISASTAKWSARQPARIARNWSPPRWDVADLKGRKAVIEIVDQKLRGLGPYQRRPDHLFATSCPSRSCDRAPRPKRSAKALPLPFAAAAEATLPAGSALVVTEHAPAAIRSVAGQWKVTRYTRLSGFRSGEHGYRALATTADGDPLVIEGPLGKGRIILALAPGLPWSLGPRTAGRGPRRTVEAGRAARCPATRLGAPWPWPLSTPRRSRCRPGPPRTNWPRSWPIRPAKPRPQAKPAASRAKRSMRPSACRFTLQPGESRTVSFAITWHFPNVQRFQHAGNLYSRRWLDAAAVAGYLAKNLDALWRADAALSSDRSTSRTCPRNSSMR